MITDTDLAQACSDVYDDASTGWTEHAEYCSINFARRQIDDAEIIVFRGSKTPIDWFRDFGAAPVFVEGVGHVHAGFVANMFYVLAMVRHKMGPHVYVTGHSLGAARALLFGQLLTLTDLIPRAVVAFAPPHPGLEDFRDKFIQCGAQIRTYENAGDPVPHVPTWPFVQVAEPRQIRQASMDNTPLGAHHMQLYLQGVKEASL